MPRVNPLPVEDQQLPRLLGSRERFRGQRGLDLRPLLRRDFAASAWFLRLAGRRLTCRRRLLRGRDLRLARNVAEWIGRYQRGGGNGESQNSVAFISCSSTAREWRGRAGGWPARRR